MQINEKALEAGARKEAEIDGRDFDALGRVDKQRYIDRLSDAIHAYLTSATPPDVARLIAELEDENYRDELQHLRPWSEIDRLFQQAATALRLSAGGGEKGWKLVPIEPTPEMIGAFWRQKNCGTQEVGARGPQTDDYSAYRAMLAASPAVEAGHVE